MADILQFKNPNGGQPHHRDSDLPIKPILTPIQILNQSYDNLKSMWDQYSVKNKLNNFIISRIPSTMVNLNADYTSDLNAISELEIKLDISNHVNFPQHYPTRETAYSAAFGYKMDYYYVEEANFTCEAHARIMNVILYIEFLSRLHQRKKDLEDTLSVIESKTKRGQIIEVEDNTLE